MKTLGISILPRPSRHIQNDIPGGIQEMLIFEACVLNQAQTFTPSDVSCFKNSGRLRNEGARQEAWLYPTQAGA